MCVAGVFSHSFLDHSVSSSSLRSATRPISQSPYKAGMRRARDLCCPVTNSVVTSCHILLGPSPPLRLLLASLLPCSAAMKMHLWCSSVFHPFLSSRSCSELISLECSTKLSMVKNTVSLVILFFVTLFIIKLDVRRAINFKLNHLSVIRCVLKRFQGETSPSVW